MPGFPVEFADLLTPKGRRILDGADGEMQGALVGPDRFFTVIQGAISRETALRVHGLIARHLAPHMTRLSAAIPPRSITGQTRNYQERLPKVARLRTAYLERRGTAAWAAAERSGLIGMMGSASYRRFAEVIAGRPLDRKFGRQVLAYGPGDYAGPHTDHHPEEERARNGYVDFHISFGHPAVAHQYLVYARGGHLSEIVDVAAPGLITIYRLPFWHYTTPLIAKPGHAHTARRFVVLGTFLYA
jgi:hypothetical protein